MDKFVIHGGRRLSGEIEVSGAKNAAVALFRQFCCAMSLVYWRMYRKSVTFLIRSADSVRDGGTGRLYQSNNGSVSTVRD